MTEPLIVPTAFGDLGELADGLVHRVGENSLILYGPTPFEAGAGIEFQVLLLDDSVALQGTAMVEEVFDGGEEREAETRYDIVLTNLQMDARSSVVFERILINASENLGDEYAEAPAEEVAVEAFAAAEDFEAEVDVQEVPIDTFEAHNVTADVAFDAADDAFESLAPDATEVAGEVAEFEAADVEVVSDFAFTEEGAENSGFAEPPAEEVFETFSHEPEPEAQPFESIDPIMVASDVDLGDGFEEVQDVAADIPVEPAADFVEVADNAVEQFVEEAPIEPAHMRLESGAEGPLNRMTFAALWSPTAPPVEPRPSTGWFAYGAGALPAPSSAPRPELAPELRVALAPQPTEETLQVLAAQDAPQAAVSSDTTEAQVASAEVAFESEEVFEAIESEPPPAELEADAATADVDFQEMPLPDADVEVAPAVEAEFVSVSDAEPIDEEEIHVD